jgi:hypothetical protein
LIAALYLFQLPTASADPISDYTRMQIFRSMPRQLMLNTTLLYGDAAYRLERQRLGRERIQAGRASTMFARTASQAPTVFSSAWQGADRENAAERFSEALKEFNRSAAGANVRLDDAAACTALAFAQAYAVRFGKMANERQRNDFAQQWRAWALRDPLYQGTDDAHRQLQLEQQEINAVLGNWFVWFAEHKPESGWTREDGLSTAEGVLKSAWTAPLDQIVLTNAGFRSRNATQQPDVPSQPQTGTSQSQTAASSQESPDSYRARGARIIAQGRATTRFSLSAKALSSDTRLAQYWPLFLKAAEQRGLATNDFAQLQALAIAINFQVYSGRTLTDKQFAWALAAMKSDVLRDPEFQGYPSAQSQASLEALAGDTISALVATQRASNPAFNSKGDGTSGTADGASAALAAQARLTAKKNLEKLFAPRIFDNYVLTEDGFAPRPGAQR